MNNEPDAPLVTIGMPTYNREWSLPRVLESVMQLDYEKKRIRICFVDNDSTDGTMNIIEGFSRDHGSLYESVVIESQRSNIARARNIAFGRAEGSEYIFFLDSDILVPPDTIKRLVGLFRSDPQLGMASLPWDTKNAKKRAGLLFGAFSSPVGPHPAYKVGNGCNIILMRAAKQAGFFNEKLRVHEDGEFCFRLRKKGFKIVCDSSSEGTHLRDITVNARFYLAFMRDSARTYRVLLADGSRLHFAKVLSSVALIASLVVLVALHDLGSALLFLGILGFAAWLNSSSMALDDGSHAKLLYRPLIGLLFTVATVAISLLVIAGPSGVDGRP
jgi:glycosyltransferase involved in cell wall biosynthesis